MAGPLDKLARKAGSIFGDDKPAIDNQRRELDAEVNALLSKQKAGTKQYEASKKAGLLNMTSEEIAALDSKVHKDTTWTETWDDSSHSYSGDFSTAQDKATAMIGGAEEKRRSEYYASLAASQRGAGGMNGKNKTLQQGSGSILSSGSRSGKNLLGL